MTIARESYALSPEFWAGFVENHWEKRPLLVKQPFPTSLATPDDLFDGIVAACERVGGNRSDPLVRFFVEHTLLEADVRRHLPRSADGSLDRYVKRVSETLDGRRVGLVVGEYPACDARIWLRLREFLRPLYDVVGLPGDPSQPVVFLGNYERTPNGLHQDPHGTFVFVIAGHKRFRMWPDEYFRDHPGVPGLLDYGQFLDGAITLEGEPGDVLYWPSTYWHIAEPLDGLAVSLTVPVLKAVWSSDDRHLRQQMLRLIEDHLEAADRAGRRVFPTARLQDYVTAIPEVMKNVTRTLKSVLRAKEFEEELKVLWLNHVSGLGFSRVPPPLADARLRGDAIIRGDPRFPILWLPGSDDKLICSANGHSFSVAAHPNLPRLLERLNSGEACSVKSLMQEYAGLIETDGVEFDASPEEIRTVLEKLNSLRALVPCARPRCTASGSTRVGGRLASRQGRPSHRGRW